MKFYGGWSLWELYNLPIGLRNYFASQLEETLNKRAEEMRKAQQNKGK